MCRVFIISSFQTKMNLIFGRNQGQIFGILANHFVTSVNYISLIVILVGKVIFFIYIYNGYSVLLDLTVYWNNAFHVCYYTTIENGLLQVKEVKTEK